MTASLAELKEAKKGKNSQRLSSWLEPPPKFLAALIALTDGNERENQLARQGWAKADAVFMAQNFGKP